MAPLPRYEKLPPERREVILRAAREEFVANGFAGASYNAIIKAAGVSKGAMYYYFADKADLYRTVIDDALEDMLGSIASMGEVRDREGYWSELRGLFERTMVAVATRPEHAELGRLIYEGGAAGGLLDEWVGRSRAFIEELLSIGQEVGAVREDLPLDLLATALTGLLVHVDRWFVERWAELPLEESARLGEATLDLVARLVAPEERDKR